MTVVAKLGSSIVAGEDGALRGDVLDRVCAQVGRAPRRRRERGAGHLGRDRARDAGARAASAALGDRRAAGRLGGRAGKPLPRLRGAPGEGEVRAAQVLLTASDLQLRTQLPERAPDAQPAARLARGPGRERERHDGHRRDHLRRQRLPRRAGGDHAGGAAARPAHGSDRALHEGPAAPRGRRAGLRGDRGVAARRATRSASTPRPSAWAACAARWRPRRWREPRGSAR